MIQIYVLTLLYLCFGIAILFTCRYGNTFLFLINVKTNFVRNKKSRFWAIFSGFILTVGNLFFPIDPGPVILGDFIPAISCIGLSIFFMAMNNNPDEQEFNLNKDKTYIWGWIISGVFILHFFVPSLVLL